MTAERADETTPPPAGETEVASRDKPRVRRVSRTTAALILWLIVGGGLVARRLPPVTLEPRPDASLPPWRLDLNRASWEDLMLLEGIGEKLARQIVAARETRGPFADIAEVQALPGVPDRPFETWAEFLVCSTEVAPPVGPTQDSARR